MNSTLPFYTYRSVTVIFEWTEAIWQLTRLILISGCDAILLGAETLRGLYPIETISTVGKICAEVKHTRLLSSKIFVLQTLFYFIFFPWLFYFCTWGYVHDHIIFLFQLYKYSIPSISFSRQSQVFKINHSFHIDTQAEKVFNQEQYFKRTVKFVGEPMTHLESIASSAVRCPIKWRNVSEVIENWKWYEDT